MMISKVLTVVSKPLKVYLFEDSVYTEEWVSMLPKDTQIFRVKGFHDKIMANYIRYERAFFNRAFHIPRDFKLGFQDRFPLCCIIHFCIDRFLGRIPGVRRGRAKTKYGVSYVPCFFCRRGCEGLDFQGENVK